MTSLGARTTHLDAAPGNRLVPTIFHEPWWMEIASKVCTQLSICFGYGMHDSSFLDWSFFHGERILAEQ